MITTVILKFWESAGTSGMGIGLSLGLKSTTTNLSVIRTLKSRRGHAADKTMLSCRDFIVIYAC